VQQSNVALLTITEQVDTGKVIVFSNQSSPGGNTSVSNDIDYGFINQHIKMKTK